MISMTKIKKITIIDMIVPVHKLFSVKSKQI